MEQVFLSFFGLPLLIVTLPLLHSHLSPPPEVCDSSDQTAQPWPLVLKFCGIVLISLFKLISLYRKVINAKTV
jgi:hypothetical protein